MVLSGQTPQAAIEAVDVCPHRARKWADRFNHEGLPGLQDRSSRPHRLPSPTPQPVIEQSGQVPAPGPAGGCASTHIRTRPYTPRTNGKAERFIQTSLREWATPAYLNSKQRAQELPLFMHRYNWHRPHASICGKSPIVELGLTEDNLLKLHI